MSRAAAGLALGMLGLAACVGTAWAFQRGGSDFNVFFEAWRAVLRGEGAFIYRVTPDRFLYAPGFAWLLSPLGLLPRDLALALWCLGKSAVLGLVVSAIAAQLPFPRLTGLGVAAAGAALWLRPLLIDYQYGQVNLYLMGAAFWALHAHRARSPSGVAAWFALGALALSKLLALPLLAVPMIAWARTGDRDARSESLAALGGVFAVLLLPATGLGLTGAVSLTRGWFAALAGRGFPLESHNQSFGALLHHWFTGETTHVIALAAERSFGWGLLAPTQAGLLMVAWSCIALGCLVLWLRRASGPEGPWAGTGMALLLLPSHLVWKPYFVLAIPLTAALAARAARNRSWAALAFVFALVNLTGFDFIGQEGAAAAEAAALPLLCLVALLAVAQRREPAGATACSFLY
jgi:hypothetical protein